MQKDDNYPLALPKGTILNGRYVLNRVLGQGGFGITYEAQDYRTKKSIAVKEYFPESAATRSGGCAVSAYSEQREEDFLYGKRCFLKEAETLAALNGTAGIVQVYSYFEENGTAYFSMELVHGKNFQQYINEHGGAVEWESAVQILTPVMDALSKVHAQGIIHRDVKPENIFLADDGTVRLLDFGSARYSMGEKSRSLDVLLTHGFAPWEQYSRHSRQGTYTDVYSLAATFYYAVTGQIPPDAVDRAERDELILVRNLNAGIPPHFESVLRKALAVHPEDRFQAMSAFQRALEKCLTKEKEKDDKDHKKESRMPVLAIIAALCITVAVFGGFYIVRNSGPGIPGTKPETSGEPEKTLSEPKETSAEPDRQVLPQGEPDETENNLDTQAKNESGSQYIVVDGRDPGITVYTGGGH